MRGEQVVEHRASLSQHGLRLVRGQTVRQMSQRLAHRDAEGDGQAEVVRVPCAEAGRQQRRELTRVLVVELARLRLQLRVAEATQYDGAETRIRPVHLAEGVESDIHCRAPAGPVGPAVPYGVGVPRPVAPLDRLDQAALVREVP